MVVSRHLVDCSDSLKDFLYYFVSTFSFSSFESQSESSDSLNYLSLAAERKGVMQSSCVPLGPGLDACACFGGG